MDPHGQTKVQGQTGALPPYQYGAADTGVRPRRKRPVWPWVAAVLALAVIAGAVVAYQLLTGTGSSIAVPNNLLGMKLLAAERQVRHAGLTPKPVGRTSVTGPYNTVTATSPPGGTKVAKGSQVILKYSVRPGKQTLPIVKGMTVKAATALLAKDGWTNVVVSPSSPIASLKIHKGDVISTNPPAGQTISLTQQILLNVSGGGVAVPAMQGLTQADAQTKLNQLGLNYQINLASGPPGTAPGTVWKTSPSRGKPVLPGGSVAVYVEPTPSSSPSPSPSPSSSQSTSPSPSPSSSSPHSGLRLPLP